MPMTLISREEWVRKITAGSRKLPVDSRIAIFVHFGTKNSSRFIATAIPRKESDPFRDGSAKVAYIAV